MGLDKDTLALELENMTPTPSEATAIDRLADAFEAYMAEAVAGTDAEIAVPVSPAGLAVGTTAMKAAMAGLSVAGQGSIKIQAGIDAFWTAIAAAPGAVFAAATAITAPDLLSTPVLLSDALDVVFTANKDGAKSLADAAAAIAEAIDTQNQGGIATFPPPSGGIGPQTIV